MINILQGYKYLMYSRFDSDLFEEIKNRIFKTIENNPESIKTVFILEYMEIFIEFSKKKKYEAQ